MAASQLVALVALPDHHDQPAGRSARLMLAKAAAGSLKNIVPNLLITRSNVDAAGPAQDFVMPPPFGVVTDEAWGPLLISVRHGHHPALRQRGRGAAGRRRRVPCHHSRCLNTSGGGRGG